jgi:GNAT superfamily N-acetyltransferase
MFVEPDWRGRGVNARLIAALKEWCRANGVTELRLDVYADNEPAVRAYRKAGFRASMVEMRVTLAE